MQYVVSADHKSTAVCLTRSDYAEF